jgi:hypothetical protein
VTGVIGARSRVVLGDTVIAAIAGIARAGVHGAWTAVAVVLDLAGAVIAGIVVADILGPIVVTGGVVVLCSVAIPVLDVVRVVLGHLRRRATRICSVLGLVAGSLDIGGGRGRGRGLRTAISRGGGHVGGSPDQHGGRYGQQRLGQSAHQKSLLGWDVVVAAL